MTERVWAEMSSDCRSSSGEGMRVMHHRTRNEQGRHAPSFAPDARSPQVRWRVARAVNKLNRSHEEDALRWIEAVSVCDEDSDG